MRARPVSNNEIITRRQAKSWPASIQRWRTCIGQPTAVLAWHNGIFDEEFYRTPIRHRVASVYTKIEKCQLQLVWIDSSRPYVLGCFSYFDFYGWTDGAGKGLRNILDRRKNVYGTDAPFLLPRDGKEPLG